MKQPKAEYDAFHESRQIMTYQLSTNRIALAVSCALALGAVSAVASAETNPPTVVDPADTGYLTDQRGAVAISGFGLCWHTGTGPAVASEQCDPTTAPTAQAAPAPQPIAVAAVAPTPQRTVERVTLDADALFDFDKAVLRPAGRAALDDFFGRVQGIDPETIAAVGHTDRLGSAAYNQSLSERRVAAVKTYSTNRYRATDCTAAGSQRRWGR
jgi:OOP family OmpA-OmpF porin